MARTPGGGSKLNSLWCELPTLGIMRLAEQGGAFDWLANAALFEEGLAAAREAGDDRLLVRATLEASLEAGYRGDSGRTKVLAEEALALARRIGDAYLIPRALGVLAHYHHYVQSDYSAAVPLYEESVSLLQQAGDRWVTIIGLVNWSQAAQHQGNYEQVGTLAREALALSVELGARVSIAGSLERLAAALGGQGQPERAARLFGAAEVLREWVNVAVEPEDRPIYEQSVGLARTGLSEAAFAAAWAAGRAMPLAAAVSDALEETEIPTADRQHS